MSNAIKNTTLDIIAARYIYIEIESKINNSKLACGLALKNLLLSNFLILKLPTSV